MGIKNLTKLIADLAPEAIKEQALAELTGRKVAIDASMAIYQFLVCCSNLCGTNADAAGLAAYSDSPHSASSEYSQIRSFVLAFRSRCAPVARAGPPRCSRTRPVK